jgi:hypothetical protein
MYYRSLAILALCTGCAAAQEYRGGAVWWREWICGCEDTRDACAIRRSTYAGAPLGPAEFVAEAEERFGRQWRKAGRPAGREKGTEQIASVGSGG